MHTLKGKLISTNLKSKPNKSEKETNLKAEANLKKISFPIL